MHKTRMTKAVGAIVGAATLMAGLIVSPGAAMSAEPAASKRTAKTASVSLNDYKNDKNLLVDYDFNDLQADATGIYTANGVTATINGKAATGTGSDGSTAARLSSGFWLGDIQSEDGSSPLKGRHAIAISYDSKPDASGNTGWSLYAARDAATPSYGREHYIGFLDKTDGITFERYNNNDGGRHGANVSGDSKADWKHVDVVVTDESTSMYIDGTLAQTVEAKAEHDLTSILGESGGILQIGKANWGAEYFSGLIDNLKVYDCADVAAKAALDAADVPESATEDFTVPISSNGMSITWTSSSEAVAINAKTGKATVTRPAADKADVKVTLTAKLGDDDTAARTFTVTVPRQRNDQEKSQADLDDVTIDSADDVRSNITVPTKGTNGSIIEWSVKSGAASIADKDEENVSNGTFRTVTVKRPAAGAKASTVVLTAKATLGESVATKEFTLKVQPMPSSNAKDEAYVWAFFTGEGVGGEKISLAASKGNNALDWNTLNNGTPLITSTKGEKGLRDPFIMKSKDGDKFYMLATDLKISGRANANGLGNLSGFAGSQVNGSLYIEVWESTDLVNWGKQRHVKVSSNYAGNTWAPEAYWDSEIGKYVVYWASNLYDTGNSTDRKALTYNRMMITTTDDFVNFSKPQVWIDSQRGNGTDGKGSIDVTMQKVGDTYYRIYKDEASMTLRQEKSTNALATVKGDYPTASGATDSWTEVGTKIGDGQSNGYGGTFSAGEGPSLFRANDGDVNGYRYYLFADQPNYHGGPNHYVPMATTDISDASKWQVVGDKMPESQMPLNSDNGRPRHGTVLGVTRAEYQAILEAYEPSIAVRTVNALESQTTPGTAPTLPKTAHLTMADGTQKDVAVEWDEVKAGSYAKPGTFTVKGVAQDDSRMPVEVVVTVGADIAEGEAEAKSDAANITLNGGETDVRTSLTLPTAGTNGSTIAWKSDSDLITTSDKDGVKAGYLSKRPAKDTKVTLTATVKNGDATVTREFTLTIKAEVKKGKTTDYLFAHFTGSEGSATDEQMYFATSKNGLTWHDTRDAGDPVLTSNVGESGVRDPYLVRSPEGDKFYLIATDLSIYHRGGWGKDNPAVNYNGSLNLVVWESTDLVNWSTPYLTDVASRIPAGNGKTQAAMAWAPEALWDEQAKQYIVYWATTSSADEQSGGTADPTNMYYSTTRDFRTFTDPVKWIDWKESVIDTTMIKADDGYYYRVSAKDKLPVERTKNPYATTVSARPEDSKDANPETDWQFVGNFGDLVGNAGWTGASLEGPELFRYNDDDVLAKDGKSMKYGLMWDQFASGKGYLPFYSADLGSTDTADWAQASEVNFGALKKRHGTILPITAAEYQAVMKAFNKKTVDRVPATSVTIDGRGTIDLGVGDTATLNVKIEPADSTDDITWSSSDGTVASVDAEGVVTGLKTGTAVITVKVGDATATVTVTVKGNGSDNGNNGATGGENGGTGGENGNAGGTGNGGQERPNNPSAPSGTGGQGDDGGKTPAGDNRSGGETRSLSKTGVAVASIVGVIVLLAVAGTALAMWRRRLS